MNTNQKRSKLFYGWIITVVAWFVYLCGVSSGAYGTSIITTQIVLTRGWNESVIGLSYSAIGAAGMVGSIIAGMILQKKGCRFTVMLGLAMGLIGYTVLAWIPVPEPVYVMMFCLLGLCSISGGIVPLPYLISSWFDKNRTLPMAVLMTAGAVGGFIYPIVAERITSVSLTGAFKLYGGLVLFVMVLFFLLIKDRPEMIGEIRDGHAWTQNHVTKNATEDKEELAHQTIPLKAVYRTRAFYMLGTCMLGGRASLAAFTSYAAINAISRGMSSKEAALILSIYGITGLAGRILSGVADRILLPRHIMNGINFLVLAAGIFLMAFGRNAFGMYLAATFFGIGYGFHSTYFALMVTDYFGDANYPVLYGMYNSVGSMGTMMAPIIVITIHKLIGSYSIAYVSFGIFLAFCMLMAVVTPVREWKKFSGKVCVNH